MAQESRRHRRERRLRMEVNRLGRAVLVNSISAELDRVREEAQFYGKQNFYATTVLKAILGQNGPQRITKGTLEQAVNDETDVFRVDPVEGDDTQYEVKLVPKTTVTNTQGTTPLPGPRATTMSIRKIDEAIEQAERQAQGPIPTTGGDEVAQ